MDWVPLPPAINPLTAVRRTTAGVCKRAKHVALNEQAVESLANSWASDGGAGGAGVGWDESGWHYSEDAAVGGNLTCTYVFVLGLPADLRPLVEEEINHLKDSRGRSSPRGVFLHGSIQLSGFTDVRRVVLVPAEPKGVTCPAAPPPPTVMSLSVENAAPSGSTHQKRFLQKLALCPSQQEWQQV